MGRCSVHIAFFAVVLSLSVSAASERDSKRIITQLKATGISKPYIREKRFDNLPEVICDSVFSCLRRRSADILAFDKTAGLITWCDTSGSFVSLPTDATLINGQEIGNAAPVRWGRYVYGAALVTRMENQNCLLTVFALARSSDFGQEAYSDGTYEKELIGTIDRDLYKASIGQATQNQLSPWQKAQPANPATNYASAFRGHFRNVPSIPTGTVRQTLQGNPYSVSTERLWSSLLNIISQYDAIIEVSAEQHKVVFARRVSIPDLNNTNATKRADALMVALVEPTSQDACEYRLAVLHEKTLLPTAIVGRTPSSNSGKAALSSGMPDFMQAATVVAAQLEQQLDTQMFYIERWGNKLLRRGSAPSLPPQQ